MKEKREIIEALEKDLMEYENVVLCVGEKGDNIFQLFCKLDAYIASKDGGSETRFYIPASFAAEQEASRGNWRIISEKESSEILEYYRMYEFSNHLKVIEDNHQFGRLMNYTETGILTEREFLEAVFL